ncbi:hypothetical protein [Pseudomonas capsici]|uniref:hypothetical protein n=1 Tax=Pseudomonas capsici TaxID=2810614 RepID=UPI0021F0C16F|nr:hypothetical protein [Pseudomonas capsici]MCV4341670.1 hypothetical protein [Pseudomonas capsici]
MSSREVQTAFQIQHWLMRRILQGELSNPNLMQLKAAINDAKTELEQAGDATEEVRTQLVRKLDVTVANLMEAVAKTTKK